MSIFSLENLQQVLAKNFANFIDLNALTLEVSQAIKSKNAMSSNAYYSSNVRIADATIDGTSITAPLSGDIIPGSISIEAFSESGTEILRVELDNDLGVASLFDSTSGKKGIDSVTSDGTSITVKLPDALPPNSKAAVNYEYSTDSSIPSVQVDFCLCSNHLHLDNVKLARNGLELDAEFFIPIGSAYYVGSGTVGVSYDGAFNGFKKFNAVKFVKKI